MNINRIIKLSNYFFALAASEKLPDNSKDIKTILNNIEELETYQARIKYAERNLKHLSSGSSRIVFRLLTPEKNVIKLAKNDKGIAQNKAEANPKIKSKYLNKIIAHAKNYSWIQTHYLDKITVKDFKKMTGLDFEDFGNAIIFGLKNISDNSNKEKPANFDKICKSKIYKEIKEIGQKMKLMPGDLARISSWGTKDNNPVLIDSGLTKDVFAEFYES